MQSASIEANVGGCVDLIVYRILLFSFHLSGKSPGITEILLTGASSYNSINQIEIIISKISKPEM